MLFQHRFKPFSKAILHAWFDLKFGYFILTDWCWHHYLHINLSSLIFMEINLDKMMEMSQPVR